MQKMVADLVGDFMHPLGLGSRALTVPAGVLPLGVIVGGLEQSGGGTSPSALVFSFHCRKLSACLWWN